MHPGRSNSTTTKRPSRAGSLSRRIAAAALIASFSAPSTSAQIIKSSLPETDGVKVLDRKGTQLPLDLVFTDSTGKKITSKELFDGRRPVLLVMAYYTCPLLCSLVLDHVKDTLNDLEWTAGKEFRVVTISFDHRNTPEQAALKKATYLLGYDREVKPDAWMFLTADVDNAQAVAKAVGFHYRFLPESGQFSHPSAIFFLTPQGKVHNFIENLEYPARDVKLALLEAAEGKTGSIFDRIELTCFMYDPTRGTYMIAARNVMKIAGAATAVGIGAVLTGLFISSKRKRTMTSSPDVSIN